ncbi:hypothetical protein D3C77_739100 [compost metagenome]
MFLLQPRLLTINLLDQRPADATHANHKHFDHLIGVEQHLMADAHASGGGIIIDHYGD